MTTSTKTAQQLQQEAQALKEEIQKQQEQLRILNSLVREEVRVEVNKGGGLTIKGLGGNFPVNMFIEQYEKLKANLDKIDAFVEANKEQLKRKPIKAFNPNKMVG
jgi:hypothetical protein